MLGELGLMRKSGTGCNLEDGSHYHACYIICSKIKQKHQCRSLKQTSEVEVRESPWLVPHATIKQIDAG